MPGEKIAAIAGDLADAESMLALKDLLGRLGSVHLDGRQDGAKLRVRAAPTCSTAPSPASSRPTPCC